MSLPDPEDFILGPQERRNWIMANVSRDLWENVSGSAILEALRNIGMGIREADFWAIRRDQLSIYARESAFADLQYDQLVPRAMMIEDHGRTLTLNSLYRFNVTVLDEETGEYMELTRAISSDFHHTPEEAQSIMDGLLYESLLKYGLLMVDIELKDVWLKPGARLIR